MSERELLDDRAEAGASEALKKSETLFSCRMAAELYTFRTSVWGDKYFPYFGVYSVFSVRTGEFLELGLGFENGDK